MFKAGIIKDGKLVSDSDWFEYLDSLKFSGNKRLLKENIISAVKSRLPAEKKKFGVLFSGGVDSSLIALICKQLGFDFACYSVGISGSKDLEYARICAEKMGFKLKEKVLSFKECEKLIKKVNLILGDIERNFVHAGVGAVILAGIELAKKDGVKILFSGLGSEEIFAGYERHLVEDVNKECFFGLRRMIYGDFLRDFLISKYEKAEIMTPFLDKKVVECAMGIAGSEKIKKGIKKYVLREIASEIGLVDEIAWRKKKAAQYGSGIDKILGKLAKQEKIDKGRYLYGLFNSGVLFSSGKDSCYSLYLMQKKGVNIKCLISMLADNPDSYMFHQPSLDLVKKQSDSIGVELVAGRTKGIKEKELRDLEKTITKAKKKFGLNSIIAGTLYSNYQRERVEKICSKLGLKMLAPMWHMNQEEYMRKLLADGFKFKIVKVACEGLDENWIGKAVDANELDKLIKLSEKYKFNLSGEGGEYETLVIDGPIFKKRINTD